MTHIFTSYIEYDAESDLYIGMVPSIPGAHTQGKTLDEVQQNLKEAVTLCLQEMDIEEKKLLPRFVATTQMEIDVD